MTSSSQIAIIGAGAAGLHCAQTLLNNGVERSALTVFEKSRGIGGRIAARRRPGFDWLHGAPVAQLSPGTLVPAARYRRQLAGLAGEIPVRRDLQLATIAHSDERRYQLRFSNGVIESCDLLLLCLPAPQIATLLHNSDLAPLGAVEQVRIQPHWSLLVGLRAPLPAAIALTAPFVRSQVGADRRSIVLHTSTDWSARQLEWPRSLQAQRLLRLAPSIVKQHTPLRVMAHRWRYGIVSQAAGLPCCWDAQRGLGAAGDWCTGRQVGDAVNSGRALAEAVGFSSG